MGSGHDSRLLIGPLADLQTSDGHGRPDPQRRKERYCVFFKRIEGESKDEDDNANGTESIRVISPFWLFNLDQIDGMAKPDAAAPLSEFQQIDAAENILLHYGAVIREEGEKDFSVRQPTRFTCHSIPLCIHDRVL